MTLFGTMPNFKVEESETVEFDYYKFGYLPDAPRLEGRRTTVNYWLIPGSPMPGALGICRHFADATRKAGGEVLYDNDRNIITVRMNQAGHETWAEFACDKDRYRVNIIERESETSTPAVVGAASPGSASQPNQTDAEFLRAAKVQKTWRPANFRFELGNLAVAQLLARTAGRFSVVVDASGSAGLAAPAQCTEPPTLLWRQVGQPKYENLVGRVKWKNIELKRGFVAQIRASKLNLVDTNTWSCHIKDGRLVEGALVTDRPFN